MPANGGRDQNRKIFIGGLNYNSTEESLKEHFSKFGQITDLVVMKFPDTKRSRGFGFVTYATDEEVDACQDNRPHVIDGKEVETKRATPREDIGKPEVGLTVKKVFVGGVKEDAEDEDIKAYFEQFGEVVSVIRTTDKESGKKRGFCFVEFNDYDPVDKAILKGQHEINGKHVDVKKAVSKENMMGGGGGGMGRGGRAGGGRGGGRGGARGGWGGNAGGRNQFQNGGGNQWGGNGAWSSGGGGGWGGDASGGAGGWGGAPGNNSFFTPGNADWGSGPAAGGYGGGPAPMGGGYNQGGYGGGPMRPAGAAGGYRTAPYGGGAGGGFRGGNRGGGGFRGGRM